MSLLLAQDAKKLAMVLKILNTLNGNVIKILTIVSVLAGYYNSHTYGFFQRVS